MPDATEVKLARYFLAPTGTAEPSHGRHLRAAIGAKKDAVSQFDVWMPLASLLLVDTFAPWSSK